MRRFKRRGFNPASEPDRQIDIYMVLSDNCYNFSDSADGVFHDK